MTGFLPPPTRIADAIALQLEARILEGSLRPGDRLAPERDLAAELGVSRPALREAIQKLVSKGLLVTRHGVGTTVTDRLDAPFIDSWQEMLHTHPGLQGDMLEFRHMLEGQSAYLAAQRATDVDLERLAAAFAALESTYDSDDLKSNIDADVAFHQAIAEAAHNAMIGHLTASLLRVVHGHVSGNLVHLHTQPHEWEQIRSQHRAIWEAIRSRDANQASEAARAHIEFVRASMIESAKAEGRRQSALRRLGEPA
ncbi:MAG: FCD domain-containing protein [Burkholderiales bacterium]|nr:FCD domain-containing protein [Burkholderiales bacterium]MDE2393864.1 FCD domain-containing protein [Burkholderiales bacterium]MDE2455028.1 FCD domain-containing protein [Burkholderiales bacterium]